MTSEVENGKLNRMKLAKVVIISTKKITEIIFKEEKNKLNSYVHRQDPPAHTK